MTETSHDTEYPRVQIALLSEVFTLQGKMEKTGCKIISGAPTTLSVKGLMMMMMMTMAICVLLANEQQFSIICLTEEREILNRDKIRL